MKRFTSTVDLKIPILAFFLTGKGLKYLIELSEECSIYFKIAENALEEYLNDYSNSKQLIQFFHLFFENRNNTYLIGKETTRESFIFWKLISEEMDFWFKMPGFFLDKNIEKQFSFVAMEILSIPSSETACERVFSNLGDILNNDKRNLGYEMLNSLLIIRMNSIFMKQSDQSTHDFIQNHFDLINN